MQAEVTVLRSPARQTLAELAQIGIETLRRAGAERAVTFYLPTRSPSGLPSGTPGEAFSASQSQRALEHASAITEAALLLVEPKARPEAPGRL